MTIKKCQTFFHYLCGLKVQYIFIVQWLLLSLKNMSFLEQELDGRFVNLTRRDDHDRILYTII